MWAPQGHRCSPFAGPGCKIPRGSCGWPQPKALIQDHRTRPALLQPSQGASGWLKNHIRAVRSHGKSWGGRAQRSACPHPAHSPGKTRRIRPSPSIGCSPLQNPISAQPGRLIPKRWEQDHKRRERDPVLCWGASKEQHCKTQEVGNTQGTPAPSHPAPPSPATYTEVREALL